MPTDIRVYVNEQGISVAHGATALDAVRVHNAAQAVDLAAGRSRLTDSRGLPIAADTLLTTGDIFRVVAVRDRVETTE